MRFNLAYFGPEHLYHVRRDFFLVLKYGLESLGHDVILSGLALDTSRFNLIVGGYFVPGAEHKRIAESGVKFAHINTEVIAGDLLNFNPLKTDFLGAYLPGMRAGPFIWDVLMNNMAEHERYGNNAHFLRWGWHSKMEDIEHGREKDLDFYFFGLPSARRTQIIGEIGERRLAGVYDALCPYFLRNDRIARAKVILNIIQEEKYTHVGSFRVCYLLNNRCAVVSEREDDPAGYLDGTLVVERAGFADAVAELASGDGWKALGEEAYEKFRRVPMASCLEELLDRSFATSGATQAAGGVR